MSPCNQLRFLASARNDGTAEGELVWRISHKVS